jgi:hypothetical protein
MNFIFYVFVAIVIIYIMINCYLYVFQRKILYLPVQEMAKPYNYGMEDTENIILKTTDSIDIVAWHKNPEEGRPVMIYLHGNAGNLGDRAEKLKFFTQKGMGLLAVSWRGFGGSKGFPSEEGLYNDARAAIDYLLNSGIANKDIFIYGESLGTGVAVQLATEYKIRSIVLEAPYTSIANRAAELYPYIFVKLLLKDHYSSIDKISLVKVPVLIFHGYLDEVMPISHGRKILNMANEPKEARFFENKGHTDFDFSELANFTYDFVEKYR